MQEVGRDISSQRLGFSGGVYSFRGGHNSRGGHGRSHHPAREGNRIRVSGSVLTIQSVEEGDAGLYRCTANNSQGVAFLQVS